MSNSWKDYFIFTAKEKKGVIVLGTILTISILYSYFRPPTMGTSALAATTKEMHFVNFEFDPNTIDSSKAILLGIPARQIKTLLKYRERGGHFYKKEDIFKLYGLDKNIATRLLPLIHIPNSNYSAASTKSYDRNYKKVDHDLVWEIDINKASSDQWEHKAGLSQNSIRQIMNYKKYLGGFTHIHQISKVYGITQETFQLLRPHLRVQKNSLIKLNPNTMNFNQWKSLAMFDDQQIIRILNARKAQQGHMGWRDLVILLDLSEQEGLSLRTKIIATD